ncbi:Unknown protein [Striga hermonthica]|uniref:Uncharacterized protein n=1 Tax=Striga hermonthica TaxID=68872 RepID=A0A9N7R7U8_STRHE|nr:Unknown protein [Striga hermonthica]
MLTSQGLVLATAMAVSAGTIFLFDHLREKYFPHAPHLSQNHNFPPQALKPCLSPGCRKRGKEQRKNGQTKRVRFANDVKDSKGNGELYRKAGRKFVGKNSCCEEVLGIPKMPPNRAVLYSGILRDRVQRMEYSY